jgi:glucokinase
MATATKTGAEDCILCGDVGGTNSRFMLYAVDRTMRSTRGHCAPGRLLLQRTYSNEGVETFCMQVERFLEESGHTAHPPRVACIAIAGPVADNHVTMTNRNWDISGAELAQKLGIRVVRLVNDFVAAGYGLLTLDVGPQSKEVEVIQAAKVRPGAPIACIGSGTGLGETFLTCPVGGGHYDAWPTEGGHTELAPRNQLEFDMVQWMKERLGAKRISVERVVSGSGIPYVYEFLASRFPEKVDPAVHKAISEAGDMKGKVIAENAHVVGSLCEDVLHMWAEHYGSEAGNACLNTMPFGGMYLAGGMTPKLMHWLRPGEDGKGAFLPALHDKGRVSPLIKEIPIFAVLAEDIGQRGAHFVAFTLYEAEFESENSPRSGLVFSLGGTLAIAGAACLAGALAGTALVRR